MNPKQRIDIAQILNEQRFSGFLIGVIVFSMILMFLDGYDTQVIAFAAPRIAQAWHIPQSSFGTVFAMGPVGMLIGGIGFGFFADIKGLCVPKIRFCNIGGEGRREWVVM
jgi:AAHS family 4-hydroxybenzoate transporter-like MFS transporter